MIRKKTAEIRITPSLSLDLNSPSILELITAISQ
jgi:hypothetical protein